MSFKNKYVNVFDSDELDVVLDANRCSCDYREECQKCDGTGYWGDFEVLWEDESDKDETKFLGDGIEVFFNTSSGFVFLSDEDCNVAIMSGDVLVDFVSCPNCGNEDTLPDFDFEDDCCQEFKKELE